MRSMAQDRDHEDHERDDLAAEREPGLLYRVSTLRMEVHEDLRSQEEQVDGHGVPGSVSLGGAQPEVTTRQLEVGAST